MQQRIDLEPVARAISSHRAYELVGKVGQGAFKQTYHVRSGSRSLALKVFLPGFPIERTTREIDAMTRCSHPNVGKLIDLSTFDFAGDRYFFLLEEFLPGGTLSERAARGLLSPRDTQMLGLQLIRAVEHIASHDLVHRDLKPDNILFRADGTTPVVVDLGLVRDLAEESLTKTWLPAGPGTPLFSAPEQLNNQKELIDWRTDQFSLAVLLSLVTFGYHPFAEETDTYPPQAIERVAERRPLPARFLADVTASGLVALARMAEVWPVDRYRTPGLLADAWAQQRGEG